jgi:hypothetical protein
MTTTLVARDVEGTYNRQQYMLTGVDVAGFSKVFSTMWGGSLYGRFEASAVFMVMLSLCNREGIVDMTPEAIAGQTGWPIDVIRKGIAELEAVDTRSRTPDHDGRRILKLDDHRDWGWRITNYVKYRDQLRAAERREYLRQAKEKERSAKRSTHVNSVNSVNQCQPIAEAEAEAEAEAVLVIPSELHVGKADAYRVPSCPFEEILSAYHENCPSMSRVRIVTAARQKHAKARWTEVCVKDKMDAAEALEFFQWYFKRAESSDFLAGRGSVASLGRHPWRADFEWLMTAGNFAKVIEGKYHV